MLVLCSWHLPDTQGIVDGSDPEKPKDRLQKGLAETGDRPFRITRFGSSLPTNLRHFEETLFLCHASQARERLSGSLVLGRFSRFGILLVVILGFFWPSPSLLAFSLRWCCILPSPLDGGALPSVLCVVPFLPLFEMKVNSNICY